VRFRWNDWNLGHATQHGVSTEEAEAVVEEARRPYPQKARDGKWLVRGTGLGGRFIQVVYVLDRPGVAFIVHARPLTEPEKRQYRRRRGR